MGIGFVLIVWAILLTLLAVPALVALHRFAMLTGGPARAKRMLRWAIVAAPLAAGYAGAAFFAYALWCTEIRGVDPGLGDWASIPLGAHFTLSFIDVPDEAIIAEGRASDRRPLESKITHIGQSGGYVYGLRAHDSAFVLDTRSGTLHHYVDQQLPIALRQVGVGTPLVVPVAEFYESRRWGWPDLVAAMALVIPILLLGGRSARRAWGGIEARATQSALALRTGGAGDVNSDSAHGGRPQQFT